MKKVLVAAWFFSLVFLACRGNETAVTGGYGSSAISGQVLMSGDMHGSSPAGVEVRARGTGIAVQTDSEGHFQLVGMPESNVELAFSRGDGIAATLTIADARAAANLQIELSKSQAKARKRGVARPKVDEIEGLITEISATTITVHDSHGDDVVVTIDEYTIIRKGQAPVAVTDLAVGDRVHVKASLQEDGSRKALEIIVQNDGSEESEANRVEIEGLITEVGAASLTVHDSHGDDVVVTVDETTIIRKGQTPVALADLVVGTRVHVKAEAEEDGSRKALEIIVRNEESETVEIHGTVASVGTDNIVVTVESGSSITVQVNAQTTIRKKNATISLSEILVGNRVEAEGTKVDDTTILAEKIKVQGR